MELRNAMMELQSYLIKNEKFKYDAPVLSWGNLDYTVPPTDMEGISANVEVHSKTTPVFLFPSLGNDHTFRKLEPQAFNVYLQTILHKKLKMQERFPNPQSISLRASGAKIYATSSRELAVKQGGWTTDKMLDERCAPVTDEQLLIGTSSALSLGVEVNQISDVAIELVLAREPQKQAEWLIQKKQAFRIDFGLKTVQRAWNMFDLRTRRRLVSIKWKELVDKSRENADWHCVVASTADAYANSSLLAVAVAKMPIVLSDEEREARMAKYCLENKTWDSEIQEEVQSWLNTPTPNELIKVEYFKGVRMPKDKADVLRFLRSMDGPQDEHRKLEDEVAAKGLSLDPVICRRMGIPLETRGTFFGGIELDFLEEDDFKAMLEKRGRGEPLFWRDNFSTVEDYRAEAAEEMKRMILECKAIQWRDVSPPPDTREEEGRVVTLLFAAMGLSSSPGISDAGVKSFILAVQNKYPSVKIWDYVDDIRGTSPEVATDFELVYKDMQRVRTAWDMAGLKMHPFRPEKLDKFIYPTQECAWIGFLVSTSQMVAKIDLEKLVAYIEALKEFLSCFGEREAVGMRELASMIGKLNFVALVVRSGRAFLRSGYDLLVQSGVVAAWSKGKKSVNPKMQLGPQVVADLRWWLETLRGGPFIPILTTLSGKSITFTVDLLDEPELFKELDPSYFIVITTD
eukprot:g16992.t1